MKPRLFKFNKLWYCMTNVGKVGLGFTPTDAYDEWVARNVR
ncbi:MAG: hypothetical protein JWR74_3205 [Polaromonas sp.]|nr:hypothetical protein [Polaromonas sp.]